LKNERYEEKYCNLLSAPFTIGLQKRERCR
jgi:hypothetical protein